MKGLLRNNIYSAFNDLKIIIPICFLAMVASLIFDDAEFTTLVVLGQMLACFGHIGTGMKRDSASKWDRFEITMPVKRDEVVIARYISFLLFALMGITISLMTVGLSALFGNEIVYERIIFAFAGGITMILLTPALAYPMMIRFGGDKSESIVMYSLMASMGIFVVFGEFVWGILPNSEIVSYRLFIICFSIILFLVSCFISILIYRKKEL